MHRPIRSALALALSTGVVGVAAAPALATTVPFKMGGVAKVVGGSKLVGVSCKGLLGTCSAKGKIVPPNLTYLTWTVPGGTISAKAVSTFDSATTSKGKFTIVGGTGKFKGASGKGTFVGLFSTGDFTYKGTLNY